MGKKKSGSIPVSTTSDINFQTESSIPQVKEFQIHSPWLPITPEKPILPRPPRPICAGKQENQQNHGNLFPEETQVHGMEWCCDSSNSIDMNRSFQNWDAALDSRVPFGSLMALADAAATSSHSGNAMTWQGNSNPPNSPFPSIYNTQFESNLWNNSSCAPNTPLYGNSIPSQPVYDLNSLPRSLTDAFLSGDFFSQFAPITPDQSKKAENKLANEIPNSSSDKQENEVVTARVEVNELHSDKEQQQLPKDLSSAAVSTQLDENHNPDKGDPESTPQQKPRRKKHRPKVVVEGKPKRTPKPVTPKPTGPKRKYVRKNGVKKTPGTPPAAVASENTDPKTAQSTRKSCRRALNFDLESQVGEERSSCKPESNENSESQAQNFCTRVESKSAVQQGQCMEVVVEKTQVGSAYDPARFMSKEFEDYVSVPERQGTNPLTPTKTYPPIEEMKAQAQNERARGKCRIVFSDETHDKQGSTMQRVMNPDLSAPKSPNESNCSSSSACLTEEDQGRGLKRGYSCTNNESNPSHANLIGGHFNHVHEYLGVLPTNIYNHSELFGLHFPPIHKKKRTEKGHNSPTLPAAQYNSTSTSTKTASFMNAQGREQSFEYNLAFDQRGRMTKKRSKVPTRIRDFASLVGILGCKQWPAFVAGGAPLCGGMQVYENPHHPHTCMEALVAETRATMTTKKRTKRNSFARSMTADATRKRIPTVDGITEYLKCLDINLENVGVTYQEQGALVPYNLRYEEQNALVLYQRDGTVVPFEGPFNPVRKRRPRPKVDLDDETTRVWKLLLENINSEGIDGTDEEKVKWWEEERRVFRGRADSFIARMHLIQGDRRFSPWKGSVVDSVIGVFLTQNVSDHLSSSAFMSLAARFPFKSKTNNGPCFEESSSVCVKEPEVCILDPEDTIEWHEEKSNQPACNRISMTLHDMDCNVKIDISNSGDVKLTNNLKCKSSDISGNGLESCHKSTANREVIQLTEEEAIFMGDKRQCTDVLSSQNSASSSQNSVDSSIAQTAEIRGSLLQDNLEADTDTRSNHNSLVGSSFMKLLQGFNNHKIGKVSSYKENGHTYVEGSEWDTKYQNKDSSDNSKASSRTTIPSNNHLQMTSNSRVLEIESFEMLGEESMFSDISKKNEENYASEQSGVTEQSVNQATVQNIMAESTQKAQKSPRENNRACSSLQGEVNKIFKSENRPVGNFKNIQSEETREQNCRMQQVADASNLSIENFDVAESTSVIHNNPQSTEHNAVESSLKDPEYLPGKAINGTNSDTSRVKRGRNGKQKQNTVEWDSLRLQAEAKGKRERTANTMDSLDYEAVRCADVGEIADTIKERGMNNMLAERMKDFLNRMVREHGSIDLEWLRDVPPDQAKEYLLSMRGLGLKSVECVRLLTLHHLAFPVDTNVGRIAVRLGWVPLQPLPESLQLHLLELYPVLESIQRYLWPRLCKLDQRTLYELHYQMITFGKVFCTKSKPNCNACPMRGECRHFASAFASARLALPGPEEKSIVSATESGEANQNPVGVINPLQLPPPQVNQQLQAQSQINNCEPIIEVPATPEPPEPTVEVPATPEPEPRVPCSDIEEAIYEDPEEIPTVKLNIEELTQNLQNYLQQNMELQEAEMSKALVALTPEAASIPVPKLKNVSRLRTEHRVYELPDSHPLLEGLDKREPDDPCSYLLAIWTPGETATSIQPPESSCCSQEFGKLCGENTCFSCNSIREANSHTVRGTLLIPCRTAMRGSFPLNGTYFQVNEVFADHESSINPIDVPRAWIWNLPRRTVYFGTSIPTIFKGLSTESIQYCFWRGFVCVRGFDQKTRAPRPLLARLHFPASKLTRTRGKPDDKQE
ncbi:transcriptional activator DEMETER-like isoform X2 [Actinidia eriantha]|uniref:transcriptional activator DEMETER-like isoform X2 n=1 Tax=Actinidia eriantha TaxID=165200 RepID=UPI002584CAFC|nr:transcriptional activator DEMETER-like isoform X2 [Actinidia eriantha]